MDKLIDFIADLLIGRNGVAPIIVDLARGFLEVAVLAGLAFLTTQVPFIVDALPLDVGQEEIGIAAALWIIGRGRGLADQFIDPKQNRNEPLP